MKFDPFAPTANRRKPVIATVVDPTDETVSVTLGFVPVENDMLLTAQVSDEQQRLDDAYGKGKDAVPFIIEELGEAYQPSPSQIAIAAGLAVATSFGDDTCEKWTRDVWLRVLYKWPSLVSAAMAKLTEVNASPKAPA